MKPGTPQFSEPHPAVPLAEGEKPKYVSQGHISPYDAHINYYNDEVKREKDTAEFVKSGRTPAEQSKLHKDFEANRKSPDQVNPYEIEISGDAMSRAKQGTSPKKTWDLRKDLNK
jgi:hypothetical protein